MPGRTTITRCSRPLTSTAKEAGSPGDRARILASPPQQQMSAFSESGDYAYLCTLRNGVLHRTHAGMTLQRNGGFSLAAQVADRRGLRLRSHQVPEPGYDHAGLRAGLALDCLEHDPAVVPRDAYRRSGGELLAAGGKRVVPAADCGAGPA